MDDPRNERCPECGADLDGARTCPDCGLTIRTEGDELTEEAVSSIIEDSLSDAGRVGIPTGPAVPYSLRLAVGLAIAVPFAPLSVFVLASILTVHPVVAVLVGVVGWLAPAAILARATVPSLVVGHGLVAVGVAVALAPPIVAAGRGLVGEAAVAEPLIDGSGTLVGSFLLFGVIVLGLGLVVSRVARRKREDWRESDAVGGSR